MSLELTSNAIRTRFQTLVEVPEGLSGRVLYDNAGAFQPPTAQIWVRVAILTGEARIADIVGVQSGQRDRTVGVLLVQIFQPIELGDRDSLSLADTVRSSFRAVSVDGVTYRVPSVQAVGRSDAFWVTDVRCPFFFDTVE